MCAKVSDMIFVKPRMPTPSREVSAMEEGRVDDKPAVTALADSLSPLLTSMKFFGLYFKREKHNGDSEKSSRRWNFGMIYSALVVAAMWIDAIRLFSVFIKIVYYASFILLFSVLFDFNKLH